METSETSCCSTPNCCSDKKKCISCGIAAIVVLFIVSVITFFIGKQLGLKQIPLCSPCPACQQATTQPSPTASPSADPTTGRTYTNDKYKYSFRYPDGYFVNEFKSWIYVIKQQMKPEEFYGLTHGLPGSLEILTYSGDSDAKNRVNTLEKRLQNFTDGQTLKNAGGNAYATVEKINLSGVTAIKETEFGEADIPTGGLQTRISFVRDNALIEIIYPNKQNTLYNKDYDQMLSTFRFD